jgi:hypothetical protein
MPKEGQVQSVRFSRKYWTTKDARNWLKKHGIAQLKRVDVAKNWYRYRIIEPEHFSRFITKKLPSNIELIIGYE